MHVRKQAAHIWINAAGATLEVDPVSLGHCFALVNMLFEHFYVRPTRDAALIAAATQAKEDSQ